MAKAEITRTHTCGELRESHVGKEVTLCGWVATRRDHGGLVFVDLRDRHGMTQVVLDPKLVEERIRGEFVVRVTGQVRARPDGMKNQKIGTGGIELVVSDLAVLSDAKTPPFEIDDGSEVSEHLRLKYRYLDLRRPSLQGNLIRRHKLLKAARDYLSDHGFIEVETPILYKSTPEGARDFVVPSRLSPGNFFALPQSPQTLKQLLMVAGMDRYFQMARCFRDEDLRADRQPEFSQIDIEASFVDVPTMMSLMEGLIAQIWQSVLGVKISTPFKRMPYREAMLKYGSDKPDLRFGLEIHDLSDVFLASSFQVLKNASFVRAIVVPGVGEKISRKDIDELQAQAALFGAKGLLWMRIQENDIQSPAAKHLSPNEVATLRSRLSVKAGDMVLMVADSREKTVAESLGSVRLALAKRLDLLPKSHHDRYEFLWVNEFPLLEFDETERRYFACHHPFTAPVPECVPDFLEGKNLGEMRASAYDLVLNGTEVGGGSLRIFNSTVQDAMFKNLGISPDEAQQKFGFFLEALKYGTPPHGGIAFGIDRLAAILSDVDAIRDVMAFPKTQRGTCLMSESPSALAQNQLLELGLSIRKG